jgi:hypothetical protein
MHSSEGESDMAAGRPPSTATHATPHDTPSLDTCLLVALLTALAGFAVVGVAYGVILGPILSAFNDPLHTNPVTSAGKAVMRVVGAIQPLAALAALLIILVALLLKGRARRVGLGLALVPLVYVVGYMVLELLMIGTWVVTLWGVPQAMAEAMARANETALWTLGDWRIQLVTGALIMLLGTTLAIVALRYAVVSLMQRKSAAA